MKPITIGGAGIAGMTAGMILRRAGKEVLIFEKKAEIGLSRHGDIEGLDGWIFPGPIDQFFSDHHFKWQALDQTPIYQFSIHTDEKPALKIRSKTPFFYLVHRGPGEGTIDHSLYKQCLGAGVKFQFNRFSPENTNIIATGTKKAAAFITGLNFRTELPDQIHLLLGRRFAPKGYAYLIIMRGKGTVATAFKKNPKYLDPLEEVIAFFSNLGLPMPKGKRFASRGSFSIPFSRNSGAGIRIGEAGGYQDFLFGFGMRMAMVSGAAAAWKILGARVKARQLLNSLNRKRRMSFINRILYEQLSDKQLGIFSEKLSQSSDPLAILSRAYNWNFKYLIRWINIKNRYEVRFL